jgi:acetyltransferase-like isoleucine patch superfamily enzyme
MPGPSLPRRPRAARQRRRADRWLAGLRRAGVQVGEDAWVAVGSSIKPGTSIGHHTRINGPAEIRGAGQATIGPYCAVGKRLSILTSNHATHRPNLQIALNDRLGLPSLVVAADVSIGPACWVGDDVSVMPGVTVGAGAVLAAGAVVTSDVAPFAVVGGVPAREIRRRCDEDVAAALLRTAWWDWPPDRLRRNSAFLCADIGAVSGAELTALVRD